MKFTYALSLVHFTPVLLIALFPVPHSQGPLLVVVLQETRACTNAWHKNNYCIHILSFVLLN